MKTWAKINQDCVVVSTMIADEEFFKTFVDTSPGEWIETDPNTRGGIHYDEDGNPDGSAPLRKNYGGIGCVYNRKLDAFMPPKPFQSWILDEENCWWNPPIPRPDDGKMYDWDETNQQWILSEQEQI